MTNAALRPRFRSLRVRRPQPAWASRRCATGAIVALAAMLAGCGDGDSSIPTCSGGPSPGVPPTASYLTLKQDVLIAADYWEDEPRILGFVAPRRVRLYLAELPHSLSVLAFAGLHDVRSLLMPDCVRPMGCPHS